MRTCEDQSRLVGPCGRVGRLDQGDACGEAWSWAGKRGARGHTWSHKCRETTSPRPPAHSRTRPQSAGSHSGTLGPTLGPATQQHHHWLCRYEQHSQQPDVKARLAEQQLTMPSGLHPHSKCW